MINHYSYSALDTFRTCPRKFRFEKIERPDVPSRETVEQRLGNTVHRALQTAYQWAFDGKLIDLPELIARFEAEWGTPEARKVVVQQEHMAVDDYIDLGRRMLSQYYERFQPFDDGVLLGAELNLTFTLPNTGFGFRSIVDRLWRRPDSGIEIWDYKTGNRLAQGARDPQYRRQMALYQLAVQSKYPDYNDITLVQYFLKHGEAIRCTLGEDELDELAEQFRQDVLAIKDAVRLDSFPTREGPICHFCDYIELCPAKRHRLLLDKEAGADGREKTTVQAATDQAEEYVRLDRQIKDLQAKQKALRDDVIRSAKELQLDKLVTSEGDLRVRITTEEKFPSRSRDRAAFLQLSMLARQWGLQECFKLDERALMKDIYKKGRLDDDQRGQLETYVLTEESPRLTAPRRRDDND